MNWGEPECLVALAQGAKVCIEVGVNEGLTARHLLAEVPTIERYVGVDVLPGYVTHCEVQRAEVPHDPGHYALGDNRFELILRNDGTLDLMPEDLPLADFVFIDGDHSEEMVRHDSYMAFKLIRPGGVIVWHDYHDLGTVGVADALHSLASQGHRITHIASTWLAFEQF